MSCIVNFILEITLHSRARNIPSAVSAINTTPTASAAGRSCAD